MKLVFIVGCPRSGTTYLQKRMVEMFGFRSLAETHYFSIVIEKLPQLQKPEHIVSIGEFKEVTEILGLKQLERPNYQEMTARTLFEEIVSANIPNLREGELVIEKTPYHGMYISTIATYYPDAQFIHIVRHPLNAISSMYALAQKYPEEWHPSHLRMETSANIWRRNVFLAMAEGGYHSYCQIKYEELIANEAYWLNRICQSLDLIQFSSKQLTDNQLFTTSFEPWKEDTKHQRLGNRNEVWKERISEEQAIWVEEYLEREMQYLGYKRKTVSPPPPPPPKKNWKYYIRKLGRKLLQD